MNAAFYRLLTVGFCLLFYLLSFGPAVRLAWRHPTWTQINYVLYAPIWKIDMLLEGHGGPGPVLQWYLQFWGVYFKAANS
jgi:hypothetical protein